VTVTGSSNGFYLSGPKGITVRGFTISKTTSYGIYVTGASDIRIENNKVLDAGSHGIYVYSSPRTTVSGNTVDDGDGNGVGSVGNGIYIKNSSDITVANNDVRRSGRGESGYTKRGIYLEGVVGSSFATGNTVAFNSEAGIYLVYGTTGLVISGNDAFENARVYTRAAPGIDLRTAGNRVEGNFSYYNEDSGIQLYTVDASNNLVTVNHTYDNGDHGIDVSRPTNVTVTGNFVCRNVTAGINFEGGATGGTALNNKSVDNGINSPRTKSNIRVDSASISGTTTYGNWVGFTGGIGTQILYIWNSQNFKTLTALHSAYPDVDPTGTETTADPCS
jgi:parallel beta-helix repeat protein